MAEHMNNPKDPSEALNPFNFMGAPISPEVRQKGYDECRTMGLNQADAWGATNGVAEQLERDKPYEAQRHAMKYLDLTGSYRLMACLLAACGVEAAKKGVAH